MCQSKINISMVDTVVLSIKNADFFIREPNRFNPPIWWLDKSKGYPSRNMKHTLNIKNENINYPKLTVFPCYIGGSTYTAKLKTEFSVTKILQDENVNEPAYDQMIGVIPVLQSRLRDADIHVPTESLENAQADVIHFSKNIAITGGYSISSITKTISNLGINRKLDVKKDRYQHEGHSLYIDCGSYQLIIYDKVQDAFETLRHCLDENRTEKQQNLLKALRNHHKNFEIFRFEVRLHNKTHINALFQKLGFEPNPSFKDILNPELSQAVLKHFWDRITPSRTDYLLKNTGDDTYSTIANYLISNNISMRPSEVMALALYHHHSREFGIRNTQAIFEKLHTPRTWYRYSKEYQAIISDMTESLNPYSWVTEIENSLNEYKPFRLEEVVKSFDYVKQSN